jgi:hypothetical protein
LHFCLGWPCTMISYLCLLSCWDYRYVPLCLAYFDYFYTSMLYQEGLGTVEWHLWGLFWASMAQWLSHRVLFQWSQWPLSLYLVPAIPDYHEIPRKISQRRLGFNSVWEQQVGTLWNNL